MKVVRESKFRHVFGEASKTKYEDVRLSPKPIESIGIRGNAKFFAFAYESGGGGTLAVVPVTRYGRLPQDLPRVTGHTGPILDFEFNPFDDNMLCSASEDMTVKIWQIPDGGPKEHMREPVASLSGHGKKVSFCTFNPTADSIVASASFDLTCKLWNIAEQEEVSSVSLADQVLQLKWNYTGTLLAATCKDKKMRLIDPRAKAVVGETKIHEGAKASKLEWLGSTTAIDECSKIITTGFSSQAERQLAVWDVRKFGSKDEDAAPLNLFVIDQGTGALYPHFDVDTQLLYLAGKGDANIRYFEVTDKDPYVHYLDAFNSTTPLKGFCFFPKRCVDTKKHEIMKGLKLESNSVVPISFKVPRKSDQFQEDLFPDCVAGAPAMTPDEWLASAEARSPIRRSMVPGEADAALEKLQQGRSSVSGVVSVKELKQKLADAEARIQALEKENEVLKAELATLKG